jgi:hypothetical protein
MLCFVMCVNANIPTSLVGSVRHDTQPAAATIAVEEQNTKKPKIKKQNENGM